MEALKKLNVPYLVSLPLVFQTTEEWLESELGRAPRAGRAAGGGMPTPIFPRKLSNPKPNTRLPSWFLS